MPISHGSSCRAERTRRRAGRAPGAAVACASKRHDAHLPSRTQAKPPTLVHAVRAIRAAIAFAVAVIPLFTARVARAGDWLIRRAACSVSAAVVVGAAATTFAFASTSWAMTGGIKSNGGARRPGLAHGATSRQRIELKHRRGSCRLCVVHQRRLCVVQQRRLDRSRAVEGHRQRNLKEEGDDGG